MKTLAALCFSVAAFVPCAAAETDTISVSAVVLPSCTVETENGTRVACTQAAAPEANEQGGGQTQPASAEIQTIDTAAGRIVLVVY